MSSLLLSAALRYAEVGYPVFPCAPGGKVPITRHGFKDGTTDAAQVRRWWAEHPEANIGMSMEGLLAVDIDGPDNPWPGDPARRDDLDRGPLSLTPRGGRHHLFRQPEGKDWRNTSSKLAPRVDTRASGGYVVVPPSVVDGKAYAWAEGRELDGPPASLPEPPEWLTELLDDASCGPQDAPHSPRGDDLVSGGTRMPPGQGDASLGDQVERRAVAYLEAMPLAVSGQGGHNATYTAATALVHGFGISADQALQLLLTHYNPRCQPPWAEKELRHKVEDAASKPHDRPFGWLRDEEAVEPTDDVDLSLMLGPLAEDDAPDHPDPGPLPERLLRVPGFVEQVMDHTLRTAPYPNLAMAFCGALCLQAFLAGRKVRDPGDNRTNLYLLGLANSGVGKEYPRKVNEKVLLAVGLQRCLGDSFASGEGLEDRLFTEPSVLFQTDEIDKVMVAIRDGKEQRFEGIMQVLLKMFTSSNGLYPMRVKAGKDHHVIDQPSLCIFGTAIPQNYYEALSVQMLTNGFFARMLILETGKRGEGQEPGSDEVPAAIVETARWWEEFAPGTGNLEHWHPVPRVVDYTPEARSVLSELRQQADQEYARAEENEDPVGMAVWARANEKARRLALVYACSENHESPLISAQAARWAWELVTHQTKQMLFMAEEHVSENQFHAMCQKLVGVLRKWKARKGSAWMPFWKLNRDVPWNLRDHEEVRETLLNQRIIEYEERRTGGPMQKLYRLR